MQVHIAGGWHDCNTYNQSIHLDEWSGVLRCPPASELCSFSDDLAWPEILAVRPQGGPMAGGTPLAVSVTNLRLEDGPSSRAPKVFVCGVEANGEHFAPNQTALMGSGRDNSSLHNPSNATMPPLAAAVDVVATTPALPALLHTSNRVACHVLVRTSSGQEVLMLRAFTYKGDYPPACRSVYDLDKFEWSRPEVQALLICLWPYVLTSTVGLVLLEIVWRVRSSLKQMHGLTYV